MSIARHLDNSIVTSRAALLVLSVMLWSLGGCADLPAETSEQHEPELHRSVGNDEIAVKSQPLSIVGCNETQTTQIWEAIWAAKRGVQHAAFSYQHDPDNDTAWAAFGPLEHRLPGMLELMVMVNLLLDGGSFAYRCDRPCFWQGAAETGGGEVRLCPSFWGPGNRAAALVHEMTHFFGFTDLCGHNASCLQNLAQTNPVAAQRNAYSFEGYVVEANAW